MEPDDMNFICGHKDAGTFGIYIHHAIKDDGHCGAHRSKFAQHPLRNADGTLKKGNDGEKLLKKKQNTA